MAISTSVKYFHSAMTGAPAVTGVAGCLISVLDACLVDGFNLKTIDSLVVSGNVATANMSTGVGAFEADAVVLITGATPAGLNGEKRILSVTANTITFDAAGITDQSATGAITAKIAPAGWAKAFTGTNVAAYRSADITGTRMYLRLDDTSSTNARVVGYESMSDVNTGVGPFPTASQMSGGFFWAKANAAAGSARAWTVIADSKGFWLHTHANATYPGRNGVIQGFGDFTPTKSGDAYSCVLHGSTADISNSGSAQVYTVGYSDMSANSWGNATPRSFTGIGSAIQPIRRTESYYHTAGHSGYSSNAMPYPNTADNSLILTRMSLYESWVLRGNLRGLLFCPQVAYAAFTWRDKVDGAGSYAGRRIMAIKGYGDTGNGSGGSDGVTFFDITGPWS